MENDKEDHKLKGFQSEFLSYVKSTESQFSEGGRGRLRAELPLVAAAESSGDDTESGTGRSRTGSSQRWTRSGGSENEAAEREGRCLRGEWCGGTASLRRRWKPDLQARSSAFRSWAEVKAEEAATDSLKANANSGRCRLSTMTKDGAGSDVTEFSVVPSSREKSKRTASPASTDSGHSRKSSKALSAQKNQMDQGSGRKGKKPTDEAPQNGTESQTNKDSGVKKKVIAKSVEESDENGGLEESRAAENSVKRKKKGSEQYSGQEEDSRPDSAGGRNKKKTAETTNDDVSEKGSVAETAGKRKKTTEQEDGEEAEEDSSDRVKKADENQAEEGNSPVVEEAEESILDTPCTSPDSQSISRPRRNVMPKNMESSSGLSWKEETLLNRALYASLVESKKPLRQPDQQGFVDPSEKQRESRDKRKGRTESLKLVMPQSDSSQDSCRSSTSGVTNGSSNSHQTKSFSFKGQVRAQRKFAQGSRPSSPSTTPLKFRPIASPRKLVCHKRAKTEDFLTFLCLRGTHALPPHLEMFNYCETTEMQSFPPTPLHSRNTSHAGTPTSSLHGESEPTRGNSKRGNRRRKKDASPAASRASSSDREISMTDNDLGVKPLGSKSSGSFPPLVMGASSFPRVARSRRTNTAPPMATVASALKMSASPSCSTRQQTAATATSMAADKAANSPTAVKMSARTSESHPQAASRYASTNSSPTLTDATGGQQPGLGDLDYDELKMGERERLRQQNCSSPKQWTETDLSLISKISRDSLSVIGSTQAAYGDQLESQAGQWSDTIVSGPSVPNMADSNSQKTEVATQTSVSYVNDISYPEIVTEPEPVSDEAASYLAVTNEVTNNECQMFTVPTATTHSLSAFPAVTAAGNVVLQPYIISPGSHVTLGVCTPHLCSSNDAGNTGTTLLLSTSLPGTVIDATPMPDPGPLTCVAAVQAPALHELTQSDVTMAPDLQMPPEETHNFDDANNGNSRAASPPRARKRRSGKSSNLLKRAVLKAQKAVPQSRNLLEEKRRRKRRASSELDNLGRNFENSESYRRMNKRQKTMETTADNCRQVNSMECSRKSRQALINMQKETGRKLIKKARTVVAMAGKRRLRSDTRKEQEEPSDESISLIETDRDKSRFRRILSRPGQRLTNGSQGKRPSKHRRRRTELELFLAASVNNVKVGDDTLPLERRTRGALNASLVTDPSGGISKTRKNRSHDRQFNNRLSSDRQEKPVTLSPSVSESSLRRSSSSRKSLDKHVRDRTPHTTPSDGASSSVKRMNRSGSKSMVVSHGSSKRVMHTHVEIKEERSSMSSRQTRKNFEKAGSPSKKPIVPKVCYRESFPAPWEPARMLDAPAYHPSIEQFQDPINYIESIRGDAESYGMCRIVPPEGWKPECVISEDVRFTTQLQYVHKMQNRWGPNVLQLECIKKHLESQGIILEQPPTIGGIEVDLPALSATIESCCGLQTVIDKNKWQKVADLLKIPKWIQDRVSRLADIYMRFLLSYDTLSAEEKQKIEKQVLAEKMKKHRSFDMECVTKGKSKQLSEFFRLARNTTNMWFQKDEPTPSQVETEYWRLVQERQQHVTTHLAVLDTHNCGSAFPVKKESPYSRHGWNFNILQHNSGSILRHIGQVPDVSMPKLHVGMVFSTTCWCREPHYLPYIHYLHTGADLIWYCIPKSEEQKFKKAMQKIVPDVVDLDDPIWLPDDSAMVSPETLQEHKISMCRTELKQGQFLVVFPKAFTATISSGYNIAEAMCFALPDWIPLGVQAAQVLFEAAEPDMFSVERLLFKLARSEKTQVDVLKYVLPQIEEIIENELEMRKKLEEVGLKSWRRITHGERRGLDAVMEDEKNRCEVSKRICYISMVVNEVEETVYSLKHALSHIHKKKNLRNCILFIRFDEKELLDILDRVKKRMTSISPTRKEKRHL